MARPKSKPRSYTLKSEPIRWSIVAPVIALIVFFMPIPAWIIDDFYSRDMYRWLQRVSTTATNILPFALLDLILAAVVIAVSYRVVRLYNVARQRGVVDALWEGTRRFVRAFAVITILFLWAWGFNYRRHPIESAVPRAAAPAVSVDQLKGAFLESASLATRLRPLAQSEGRYYSIALELRDPMNAALRSLSREPLATPSSPKYSLFLSPFFTWAGVTGMMNPFGHESIVLPDLLPYERAFVLAHEWAHLAGHGDEAEASAIGWLACMKGGPTLAYSASVYLVMETASAMPDDVRSTMMAKLDPALRTDLDAIVERMRKGRPSVQRAASAVYDDYLKANRVADGTASYGRAVRLILSPAFYEGMSGYTVSR